VITRTSALLLRKVNIRESDLVVTLFTQTFGKVGALARNARRSKTRFVGSLEPMHTLSAELEAPHRGELFELRSLKLERTRLHLTESLPAMTAAGRMLGWVRKAAPDRQPEPEVYRVVHDALDALDGLEHDAHVSRVLALSGLRLCRALGWGLAFEQCVGCGATRPAAKSGYVDPARGGLVCSSCGAGGTLLDAALLTRLGNAQRDPSASLNLEDSDIALRLLERTLAAHGNFGADH
jgi:DNA repair protein RecO (recombination protein O)